MTIDKFKILYALNAYCKQLEITDINLEGFISNHLQMAEKLVSCFERRFNPNSPKEIPFLESDFAPVDAKYKKLVSIFSLIPVFHS